MNQNPKNIDKGKAPKVFFARAAEMKRQPGEKLVSFHVLFRTAHKM